MNPLQDRSDDGVEAGSRPWLLPEWFQEGTRVVLRDGTRVRRTRGEWALDGGIPDHPLPPFGSPERDGFVAGDAVRVIGPDNIGDFSGPVPVYPTPTGEETK